MTGAGAVRVYRRVVVASTLLFSLLALFVSRRARPPAVATDLDQHIRAYPGQWRFDLASVLRAGGALPVAWLVAIAGAVVLVRVWNRGDLAVLCIAAPVLAGLAGVVIKEVIIPDVSKSAALQGAYGYGFPSVHAAVAAALVAVVVIVVPEITAEVRLRVFWIGGAVALALAVAASNVIEGAHRSLDVVGGGLLGVTATLVAALATAAWNRARDAADEVVQ